MDRDYRERTCVSLENALTFAEEYRQPLPVIFEDWRYQQELRAEEARDYARLRKRRRVKSR
jgi:hypothetical protein